MKLYSCLFALIFVLSLSCTKQKAERPNIIFISVILSNTMSLYVGKLLCVVVHFASPNFLFLFSSIKSTFSENNLPHWARILMRCDGNIFLVPRLLDLSCVTNTHGAREYVIHLLSNK